MPAQPEQAEDLRAVLVLSHSETAVRAASCCGRPVGIRGSSYRPGRCRRSRRRGGRHEPELRLGPVNRRSPGAASPSARQRGDEPRAPTRSCPAMSADWRSVSLKQTAAADPGLGIANGRQGTISPIGAGGVEPWTGPQACRPLAAAWRSRRVRSMPTAKAADPPAPGCFGRRSRAPRRRWRRRVRSRGGSPDCSGG